MGIIVLLGIKKDRIKRYSIIHFAEKPLISGRGHPATDVLFKGKN
jgi:hypothetical protein